MVVPGVLPDPSATPIPLPNTVQMSAPSGQTVWALLEGQRLFRSSDRGATWQARGLPPNVPNGEVSFVDDQEGWLSAPGSPATQCQQQSFALWHTLDAGTTWTRLAANGIAAGQCKVNLAFVDRTHGFVVASDPNHSPVVYCTGDGGLTWTASAPMPDPPGFTTQLGGASLQPGTVRSFGQTLLLPVSAGGASQGVYRSTDGGATWAFVTAIPNVDGGLGIAGGLRWIMIGSPSQSIETTDGGTSWHPFASDYTQASPIAPVIVFGDAEVGFATTRGAIQRTVDGGAYWTRITTPGTG